MSVFLFCFSTDVQFWREKKKPRQSATKVSWPVLWPNSDRWPCPSCFQKPVLCFHCSVLVRSGLSYKEYDWKFEQDAHRHRPWHHSEWTVAPCQNLQRHLLTLLHQHWLDHLLRLVRWTSLNCMCFLVQAKSLITHQWQQKLKSQAGWSTSAHMCYGVPGGSKLSCQRAWRSNPRMRLQCYSQMLSRI